MAEPVLISIYKENKYLILYYVKNNLLIILNICNVITYKLRNPKPDFVMIRRVFFLTKIIHSYALFIMYKQHNTKPLDKKYYIII